MAHVRFHRCISELPSTFGSCKMSGVIVTIRRRGLVELTIKLHTFNQQDTDRNFSVPVPIDDPPRCDNVQSWYPVQPGGSASWQ